MPDVIAANNAKLPSSKQWASTADRILAQMRDNLRGPVQTVINGVNGVFDKSVQEFDKKKKTFAYRDGGEYLAGELHTEADGMSALLVDTGTKHMRDHLGQLKPELGTVPEIKDAFRAQWLWTKLDAMESRERETFLSRTDDPEVASAVWHAPAAFPIGSDEARQRMLTNYNKRFRADKLALADDLGSALSAVTNYREMVMRELRQVLR